MVKMMFSDETLTFVWFCYEKSLLFFDVLLIWGSSGNFLGIEHRFFDIEHFKKYELLQKCFWPQNRFSNKNDFSITKQKKIGKETSKSENLAGKNAKKHENSVWTWSDFGLLSSRPAQNDLPKNPKYFPGLSAQNTQT